MASAPAVSKLLHEDVKEPRAPETGHYSSPAIAKSRHMIREDPSRAVQEAAGLLFVPRSPEERFSTRRPALPRRMQLNSNEQHLLPIDVLFGTYHPRSLRVTIFYEQIQHYSSKVLGCSPELLEWIVRVHEYAHGIVHLGLTSEAHRELAIGSIESRSWETSYAGHLRTRTEEFLNVDKAIHEQVAQAITWITLNRANLAQAKEMQDLFQKLMQLQPWEYRLRQDLSWLAMQNCEMLIEDAKTMPCGRFMAEPAAVDGRTGLSLRESLWDR